MAAELTLSNIKTTGETLHATLAAGVLQTYSKFTVTLNADSGSLPGNTYELQLWSGTTLLASTEQTNSTSITVTGGVGSGVLSTETTAAQTAVANNERIPAVLILHDSSDNYAPARIPVTLWRNEAGEAAQDLVATGVTVPSPAGETDGSIMQALSGAWAAITRDSWLGTLLTAIRGIGGYGTANQVLRTNATADGVEWGTSSGDLLAANNLSDLANAATARTNLGVAIGTDVQAYSANNLLSTDIDTLAELNAIVSDATLIDTADSRLSDDRAPTAHASEHTDGTDDIQDATAARKGLATAAQIAKLDGIEAGADVTDAVNVAAAGAPIITSGAGAPSSTPAAVGDIYVDTTGDNVWQAAGTASSADWKQSTGVGGGDLLAANNLSDVANVATARTNLGLAIGSDVQAYSANNVETTDIDTLAELNAIISDATLIDTADSRLSDTRDPNAHASEHTNGTDDIQDATALQKGLMTSAYASKLDGIEAAADVTDATNVNAAGAVMETDYGAQTILAAVTNNTPAALTVQADRIVGRATGGNVDALTAAQVRTILNVEDGATADQTGAEIKTAYEAEADTNAFTDADHSKLDGIEAGADVTDATNVNAAGAVMESDYNAQTILAATTDNTPAAVIVAEAQIVGRATGGNVGALTAAQVRTILNVENGATADQSNAEIETAYNAQVAAASQAEMEAGTESGIRRVTPERVKQAVHGLQKRTLSAILPDPNSLYSTDTSFCLVISTQAALTVNAVKATCDADPATELDWDLYFADDFISKVNATLIRAMDTTAGELDVSTGWTDNTVPAGKAIYISFGAQPIAAIKSIALQIEYSFD